MYNLLKGKYGEVLTHQLTMNTVKFIEIFVNHEKRTWTILETNTMANMSCIKSSGTGYIVFPSGDLV